MKLSNLVKSTEKKEKKPKDCVIQIENGEDKIGTSNDLVFRVDGPYGSPHEVRPNSFDYFSQRNV